MMAALRILLLLSLKLSFFRAAPASDAAEQFDIPRRLVIDGSVENVSSWPFAAMLVVCGQGLSCVSQSASLLSVSLGTESVAQRCSCQVFCSGALISSGAVLTAAHCMQDNRVRSKPMFNATEVQTKVAVVLGSDDLKSALASNFFKIRTFTHAGFTNLRQTFDNDVALVFLDSCVPAGDKYKPVKVATRAEFNANAACTNVTALGWGREQTHSRNLWGTSLEARLTATHDHLHVYDSCLDSMSQSVADRRAIFSMAQNDDPLQLKTGREDLKTFITDDRFLCFGGPSPSGVCHGDSGGPILARAQDQWVVLGVSNFVMGLCAVYADFGTRVPFHASWIADQLSAHDNCQSAEEAFLSWPVPPWQASEAEERLHCHQDGMHWVCPSDGACIEWSKHCDGEADCSLGEDEFIGCETDHFKSRCEAAVNKFRDVMDSAKTTFWAVYDTYLEEYKITRRNGGTPTQQSHARVGEICTEWITELLPLIQNASFSAVENQVLQPCLLDHPKFTFMKEGRRAWSRPVVAMALVDGCAEEVMYNKIFIANRSNVVQSFAENIQRCTWPNSLTSTESPSQLQADHAHEGRALTCGLIVSIVPILLLFSS